MSRYIDADRLTEELQNMINSLGKDFSLLDRDSLCMMERGIQTARQYVINLAPIANVQEIKHGKWIKGTSKGIWFCSECTRHIEDRTNEPNKNFPYCHCGAKMDGE